MDCAHSVRGCALHSNKTNKKHTRKRHAMSGRAGARRSGKAGGHHDRCTLLPRCSLGGRRGVGNRAESALRWRQVSSRGQGPWEAIDRRGAKEGRRRGAKEGRRGHVTTWRAIASRRPRPPAAPPPRRTLPPARAGLPEQSPGSKSGHSTAWRRRGCVTGAGGGGGLRDDVDRMLCGLG